MKENETAPNIWCVPLKPHNFIHYTRNLSENGYYFPQIEMIQYVFMCGEIAAFGVVFSFSTIFNPNL